MYTDKSKKLTKRERKQLRGPNAAVKFSIENGETRMIGDGRYFGKNPRYFINPMTNTAEKTSRGIPFVRG